MLGTIFTAFGLLFAIIGIIVIIVGIRQKSDMKDCREVIARIVDFEVSHYRRHNQPHTYYAPVYEYTDLGETKRYTSSVGQSINNSRPVDTVGTQTTLYLSKSGKIYENRAANMMIIAGVAFTVFGVFFAALGMVFTRISF